MNYSRRQLEAFGEPLGECVTRKEGGRIIYGGGGNAPSTSTQVTDLPDWAKPYAQEALEKGKQLTSSQNIAQYDQPRIAGFSPLQEQAQSAAGNLQTSSGLNAAQNIAGTAAIGGLNARYNPFQMGQFTSQAAGQYMNPFLEQAMSPQLREAQRASEMQAQANQAQAVKAGAFGGSRQAIVEAERQRNLAEQQGDIRARGYQAAFDRAQDQFAREQQLREQSRQFGANIGMQGLQTALQGAGQLGALGAQEFGQQKDIIDLQSKMGAQQQALRQQGLTQAYQDFLNEQNYPYKQLGFYADLIRGLPLGQQTTKQVYESPGNALGQIAGLGVGLGGMARFGSMFAEGGQVNGYAEGGDVTSDYKVDQILGDLSDVQLEQARLAALNRGDKNRLEMIDEERAERASLRAGLGNAFDSLPPDFREQVVSAASGGMVAFDEGGQVDRYQTGGVPGVPSWLQWMYSGESQKEKERRQQVQRQGESMRRTEVAGTEAGPLAPAGSGLGMLQRSTGILPAGSGLSMIQQNLLNSPEAQRQLAAEAAAKREIEENPRREAEAEATRESRRQAQPATAATDEASPTPRGRRQESSTAQAARIVADVAKTQVPKDDVKQLYEEVLKGMKSAPSEESEALARMLQKAEKRSEEIKARGVGEALMRFGFGMAKAAAKPGRRSGIAGVFESAAEASPLLAESMAENEKLQSAADDNALKLRMEQARLKSATEQGNRQLAASLAGSISQRNIQQATLEEAIAQNARANALKQQEMASMAAARAKPSSVMEYVYNTLSRDPKNAEKSPQELLQSASDIVNRGSLARTEMSGVNQAMKLKKDLEARRALFSGSDSPLAKSQVALIDSQIAEINRQYGLGAGVTSATSPGAGAGMRIVNVTE